MFLEGAEFALNNQWISVEDDGSVVCLFGKKAKEIDPPRRSRIAGSRFFEIKSCAGCPYRKYCKKAFKKKGRGRIFEINMEFLAEKKKAYANLLSPKGIEMRVNRSCRVPNYFIKVFANCFMKKSADCTTYMQKVPLARNFFD